MITSGAWGHGDSWHAAFLQAKLWHQLLQWTGVKGWGQRSPRDDPGGGATSWNGQTAHRLPLRPLILHSLGSRKVGPEPPKSRERRKDAQEAQGWRVRDRVETLHCVPGPNPQPRPSPTGLPACGGHTRIPTDSLSQPQSGDHKGRVMTSNPLPRLCFSRISPREEEGRSGRGTPAPCIRNRPRAPQLGFPCGRRAPPA